MLGVLFITSCKEEIKELPILGKKTIVDGQETHHKIPDWQYLNQDSVSITNKDLSDYIYVADFFFRSCPSICPKVMKEMKTIYSKYENDDRVRLVSFTLDPKRDTPEKLKTYASNLGVDDKKWWFIHTDDDIYDLAYQYFVTAYADDDAPGGFDHSGKLLLVDKKGHIRSFSEGTDPSETPKMISSIRSLLASYE